MSRLRDLIEKIESNLERLLDTHLCIGIAGLSQSGKTTFVTSLINQLENYQQANLASFSPALSGRLLGVKVHSLNHSGLAEFPYRAGLENLHSTPPKWPTPTTGSSGCLLELRLKSTKSLNPLKRDVFSLFLEIRDYPGEWLLDLPLRNMNFARWSNQCSAQYQASPRHQILGELYGELLQIDPLADCDHAYLEQVFGRFVAFLKRCKNQGQALSLIQPGRFLLPGDTNLTESSKLHFIPLLNCKNHSEESLKNAAKNSYYKVCEARYQHYVKTLVEPFYKEYFSKIDRQIVLVDVVQALNGGPNYLTDMSQAMSNIMDSFAYGEQNRLLQLFNPKIDKVMFAATKIDQVLSEDHDAVRQLLADVVRQAYANAAHEGIEPECEAIASVRASRECDYQNERGLQGHNQEGQAIGYVHPRIPARIPSHEQWQPFMDWKIPTLNPPKGLKDHNKALPHIRLDIVLNYLIGDKCK